MKTVRASSFADPADVEAFYKCKAQGHSDEYCFRFGDNGIGCWNHKTAQTHTPMVAIPRDEWTRAGKRGGAKVRVTFNGKTVDAILGDTMPSYANITNGCGIDLNPATAMALGLEPPFIVEGVQWEWI